MLNDVCERHGHEPGLPEPDLRQHVLAVAIHTVETDLVANGYAEPDRALEVLHVAIEDALEIERAEAWVSRGRSDRRSL